MTKAQREMGGKGRSGHNLQENKLEETRNDSIDGINEMKMQIGYEINQELQHPAEEDDDEIEKLMNAWAKKYEGGKYEETATQIRKEISQETQHPSEEEDDGDAAEEEDG